VQGFVEEECERRVQGQNEGGGVSRPEPCETLFGVDAGGDRADGGLRAGGSGGAGGEEGCGLFACHDVGDWCSEELGAGTC